MEVGFTPVTLLPAHVGFLQVSLAFPAGLEDKAPKPPNPALGVQTQHKRENWERGSRQKKKRREELYRKQQ